MMSYTQCYNILKVYNKQVCKYPKTIVTEHVDITMT